MGLLLTYCLYWFSCSRECLWRAGTGCLSERTLSFLVHNKSCLFVFFKRATCFLQILTARDQNAAPFISPTRMTFRSYLTDTWSSARVSAQVDFWDWGLIRSAEDTPGSQGRIQFLAWFLPGSPHQDKPRTRFLSLDMLSSSICFQRKLLSDFVMTCPLTRGHEASPAAVLGAGRSAAWRRSGGAEARPGKARALSRKQLLSPTCARGRPGFALSLREPGLFSNSG